MGIELESNKGQQPSGDSNRKSPSQEHQQQRSQMGDGFGAQRQQSAPQTQGNNVNQQAQAPAGFSFRSLGRLANSPMGRTPASEVLVKLEKALTTVYASVNPVFGIKLIPLDMNSNPAIARSALIVALFDNDQPNNGVAYHTLILAASGEPFPPRYEQINGQNVEIMRLDCEVWDDKYREVAADTVQRIFPQAKLIASEATVVPRDFDLADEALVYMLASNTLFANNHELNSQRPGFADLNLAGQAKDANLTARVQFNQEQLVDAVGEPMRTDVMIELVATATQTGQGANQDARATKVSQIGGFLDLVWDPQNPVQNNPYANWGQQQQPQFSPLYVTHFVMTHVETLELMTAPAQLFALVQAMSIRDNNAFWRGFQPRPYAQGIDIHDIGAIGIEANPEGNPNGIGSRIDTKSDAFVQQGTLAKLLQAFVRPGLLISIDVPECGPSSWSNSAFAAAAEGIPKANEFLINAAMTLTNGNFKKHYQGDGRVAFDNSNRIHLGHYTDPQGRIRDIRDIDYLAVANLIGEKDPSIIKNWSDTFVNLQIPPAQRLATRKSIIQGLVNDSAVFTGYARRATLAADFMEALAKGCVDTGLVQRTQYPYGEVMGQERAAAQFGAQLLMNPGSSGLFQQNFGNNQNAGGWRSSFGSRW